jgi:predicted DNA-binding mobile mystery protein A
MKTPVNLIALELFDKQLPQLQRAADTFRNVAPRHGWVNAIRKSLGMPLRAFAKRLGFKEHASVKALERNESAGTITLDTLRRAAEALDAEFVYAIVPRKKLREQVAARAREIAEQRVAPIAKSMAFEKQAMTEAQIERQVREIAAELERTPEVLWR